MSKLSVKAPSGFRDFPPVEANLRSQLTELITKNYRSWGFQQIATPSCENLSVLLGKGGGTENEKLIFKLLKRGEALKSAFGDCSPEDLDSLADLGLRFDLTLPLARYYSRFRNELPQPFKAFNIGSVWRAERPQKGRYRELVQCDIDVIGSSAIGAEVDTIAAAFSVFTSLGLNKCELLLNDRKILDALAGHLKIEAEAWADCLISLDKIEKIGFDKVESELSKKIPADKCTELLEIYKNPSFDWKKIAKPEMVQLELLADLLAPCFQSGQHSVKIQPTLVRGQDYYTGTIFEFRAPQLDMSIGGGGRYDSLLELWGSQKVPACGASIGFERILLLLQENSSLAQNLLNIDQPDVFFPIFSNALQKNVLELAQKLRDKGLKVDVYPEAAKMKSQFRYASSRQAKFVAILGEDELKASQIKVKDMQSSQEEEIALEEFEKVMEQKCLN